MRLRFKLLLIALVWVFFAVGLNWVAVRYVAVSPRSAFQAIIWGFVWPVPGIIRLVRQLQRQNGLREWVDERKILLALSLFLGFWVALTHNRFWWLLTIASNLWAVTAVCTLINSRFGVALVLWLFKG